MTFLQKMTPILAVSAIEPCLPFWREMLGFSCVQEVPHGERLGFAILVRDQVTVMLQTHDSLEDDLHLPGDVLRKGKAILYVDVSELDALVARLPPELVVCPRRKTWYGADEIFVRDPEGNIIGFSMPAKG